MAANLAGMFSQLNNAIQSNPTADIGSGLIGTASQSAGNMLGGAMDMPERSMEFMNQQGKEQQAQAIMGQVDAQNPESMEKAAQALMAAGNLEAANKLMAKAQSVRAAQKAEKLAVEARAKEAKQLAQAKIQQNEAAAYAARINDPVSAEALKNGAMSAESFYSKQMEKKRIIELADGAMAFDDQGKLIASNPKDTKPTGPYQPSVYDAKKIDLLIEDIGNAEASSARLATLAQQIAESDWKAGAYSTVDDMLDTFTGTRDKTNTLRSEWQKVRTSSAVERLPKGPASDKDIAMVLSGEIPLNAGKEEIVKYVTIQAQMAKMAAAHDRLQADLIAQGRRGDFLKEWEKEAPKVALEGNLKLTEIIAPGAVGYLMEDYEGRKDAFRAEFGFLPPKQ